MSDIKFTYKLNLVDEREDPIMSDPVLLKKVAEFYNTNKDLLLTIANTLNEPDARDLIQHAVDEEVFVLRGKMVGRESFYTDLVKYSKEQERRDAIAKEEATTEPEAESLPTADEELTLEES